MNKVLAFVFLISSVKFCIAQDPIYYQYNPNNGLPSNEVYDVIADPQGYLWFGTDRGIARFNGTSFKHYTVNDGLSDNLVYKLFLSPKGVIWAVCNDKTLHYFKANKFESYHLNKKLQNLIKLPASSNILNIQFKEEVPFVIGTNSKGFIKIINNEKFEYDSTLISELRYDKISNASAFIFSPPLLRKNIAEVLPYQFQNIKKGFTTLNFKTFSAQRKNGETIVSFDKWIYVLKNGRIIASNEFDVPILNMYLDANGDLWLCFFYNGVKLYKPSETINQKNGRCYFSNQTITDVQQDFEGGYWFSTYNQGVYYIPKIEIEYVNIPELKINEDIKEITGDRQKKLFIATNKNRILIQEDGITKFTSETFNSNTSQISICNDLYFDQLHQRLLVGFSDGLYLLNENGKTLKQLGGLGKCITSDGNYWVAANVSNVKKIEIKHLNLPPENLTLLETAPFALYIDSKKTIWVGVNDGIVNLRGKQKEYYKKDKINIRINNIKEIENGSIVLSSLGLGIFIIQDEKVNELTLGESVQNNMVNDLAIEGNVVWAATQKGVVRIDLNNINKPKLSYLSVENGFPFNDIRKIYLQNRKVYVVAQNKLIAFPSTINLINNKKPKIELINISTLNQSNISPRLNYPFTYDDQRIQFHFNAVAYRAGQNIKFNYRLKGLDSTWRKLNQNNVEFNSLDFGTYTFEVVAINEDGFTSQNKEQYRFTIPPPFWKTYWFYGLMTSLISLLIYFYFRFRIRNEQQRNREKEEMLLNEQQALLAQVNPHFIFNALNSIQNFILKSDQLNAIKYLGRFSRLMRLSLDHANLKWIPIDSEIKLLNTYLELEKLRFKDQFEYEISISNNSVVENIQIPSMLIQPFVENAIIHGLKELKERKGELKVVFTFHNSILICEIIDNGIGFKNAQAINKSENPIKSSYGVAITKKRLELINKEVKLPYVFEQINRIDAKGNVFGTLIKLSLPYKTLVN